MTATRLPHHTSWDAPTTTLPRVADDTATIRLPRADGYLQPKPSHIARLIDDMREHRRKRLAAAERWAERDAQIKARWRVSWKVRIAKRDDTVLDDCWSEYTFHRDEGMVLAAEIQAECAALAALRGCAR